MAPAETAWEVVLRGILARALIDRPRVSHRRPAGAWVAMMAEAQAHGAPEPAFQPGRARQSDRPASPSASTPPVHEARRLDSAGWRGLRDVPLRTGGGTDFAPVVEAAGRLAPSIAVMLTDLDAPFGPAPAYPVLWAVPGGRDVDAPPFGRILRIGDI
jgi:hypothetical protein